METDARLILILCICQSRGKKFLPYLQHKGFVLVEVDIIALARQCIGTSQYHRGARPSEAPTAVDCSSLIKWLYGMRGIWLPRRSIQQCELGGLVNINKLIAGDAVFTSGRVNYHYDDSACGIGHVGIATGNGTIIHAANKEINVVESPVDKFVGKTGFRGARRYIPKDVEVLTLEIPADKEVEIADDFRWIILQALSNFNE